MQWLLPLLVLQQLRLSHGLSPATNTTAAAGNCAPVAKPDDKSCCGTKAQTPAAAVSCWKKKAATSCVLCDAAAPELVGCYRDPRVR